MDDSLKCSAKQFKKIRTTPARRGGANDIRSATRPWLPERLFFIKQKCILHAMKNDQMSIFDSMILKCGALDSELTFVPPPKRCLFPWRANEKKILSQGHQDLLQKILRGFKFNQIATP